MNRIRSPARITVYISNADADSLLEKARATYQAGYRSIAAYSPFPIAELPEAIGLRRSRLPWLVLLAGIGGAIAGFGMQYYAAVIDYPWNIGGRPPNSWPSFIIVRAVARFPSKPRFMSVVSRSRGA